MLQILSLETMWASHSNLKGSMFPQINILEASQETGQDSQYSSCMLLITGSGCRTGGWEYLHTVMAHALWRMMLLGITGPQALPDPKDSDSSTGAGDTGYRYSSQTYLSSPQPLSSSQTQKSRADVTLLFAGLLESRPSNSGHVHDSPFIQK